LGGKCPAILIIFCATGFFSLTNAQNSYTLDDCYRHALGGSMVTQQRELIAQAEERTVQARSALLPRLETVLSYSQQESDSTLIEDENTSGRIGIRQPLFGGFGDWAAIEQSRYNGSAAKAAFRQTELRLFLDTAQAYYNILIYEKNIINYRKEIASYTKRKKELQRLKNQARAKESDLIAVDSAIASFEAAIAQTMGSQSSAREQLTYITGLPSSIPLRDGEELPPQLGDLDLWNDKIDEHPQVLNANLNYLAAQEYVKVAQAEYYPSVVLTGDYYYIRPDSLTAADWNIGLSVTLPLYTGGNTTSLVREAEALSRQQRSAVDNARQSVRQEINTLYIIVQAELEQVRLLEKAVTLSNKSYQLLLRDNQTGLATNLEVLQSLASLYQSVRAFDQARLTAAHNHTRLRAVTGRRSTGNGQASERQAQN